MKVEIVEAKPEHIPYLAENMREADKNEIWDMALLKPYEALEKSLKISVMAKTGLLDGLPVCMFGVADSSMLFDEGRPWLLGTDDIEKCAIAFLRRNKPEIKAMLDCFNLLENYVSVDNKRSIEWLKWLGFNFDDKPLTIGLRGQKFIRFWMVNE